MASNAFIQYYGEHHISPVRQDIDDFNLHLSRRRKLFRQCGVPVRAFQNAEVLEVGAGSGFNALTFFHWGGTHVDIVEPNPRGREDIKILFSHHGIDKSKYALHTCPIEEYATNKQYDILLAEGFLQYVQNQEEIIEKLKTLANKNGIIVVTCSDYVGDYIERMKRLIGRIVTQHIEDYEDKIHYLVQLFARSFNSLKGMSRLPEDWVRDNFFNPSVNTGNRLSLIEAMQLFGEGYVVCGTSPRMFVDYSWYKDVWVNDEEEFKRQYRRKCMSLAMANMAEITVSEEEGDALSGFFEKILHLADEFETSQNKERLLEMMAMIDNLNKRLHGLNYLLDTVFTEAIDALRFAIDKENIRMEEYPHFYSAFGRTQQYIAFEKIGEL